MDRVDLGALLDAVAAGAVDAQSAADELCRRLPGAAAPAAELAFADVDHHRPLRTGEPEVVYAEHKTPAQVAGLLRHLLDGGSAPVLATRAGPEHAAAVPAATYDPTARLLVARARPADPGLGSVAVVCAGTSDLPVAAEAAGTLRAFGLRVELVTDVGVAGVHRLLRHSQRLRAADVCVVVAGMEGALPSVVGGLVDSPVVAVPTSVGYGAAFSGMAALLGMLTSCAPGISVVNIDNGFGAAMVARRILRLARRQRDARPAVEGTPSSGPADDRLSRSTGR